MSVCRNVDDLRALLNEWRKKNESIAFVPTMGNLHDGHLSLVEIAQRKAVHVVVSIFVNPLQFSPDEDFASYPRTLDEDLDKLKNLNVGAVFTPDTSIIYPEGEHGSTFVEVPVLSDILEGEFRPGFFRGVATVVLKLLNIVQPDCAIFGEKDFQQLLIIRRMVKDLNLPVEILAGGIKRETDGLAMSSRNAYLDANEREKSRMLSAALKQFSEQVLQNKDIELAQSACVQSLQNHGFDVDYVALRETSGLDEVPNSNVARFKELIILAAVRIGKTRLIDNIKFTVRI